MSYYRPSSGNMQPASAGSRSFSSHSATATQPTTPAAPTYGSFLGTTAMKSEDLDKVVQTFIESYLENKNKPDDGKPKNAPLSVKDLLTSIVQQSGPLYKQYKITQSQLEGMYNIGYQAFQHGNYRQAIGIFRILFLLHPLEPKYIFSLGLSLEKSKKHFEATTAYLTNSYLEESNPIPVFRTAICFMEMGENAAAKHFFQQTITLCEVDPVNKMIQERAQLFLNGLEKSPCKSAFQCSIDRAVANVKAKAASAPQS